jgi:DNA-binding NarL/FixJ family response regulator
MANQALNEAATACQELGIPDGRNGPGTKRPGGAAPDHERTHRTERRIAELVGSGHSNHDAAAELFMSVKTVEANLTRIYRKLWVRPRTQLANRLNTLDSETHRDE